MLGRGLESLIPGGGNNNSNNNNLNTNNNLVSNFSRPVEPEVRPEVQGADQRPKPSEAIFQIEVERIRPNPHQPRRYFDEEALNGLALSIREFGVLQPLIVTKVEEENDGGTTVSYELIAGERRLMASKRAGLRTVPAIIRSSTPEREKFELAIIENIQRSDLNPIEEARAYARLQDEFHLTQREIASRLGKSREVIANAVRLLNLPSEIQEAVSGGKVNESQARLLLSVEDIPRQRELFAGLIRDNMSVRELKAKVNAAKNIAVSRPEVPLSATPDPEFIALRERLEEFFGTEVDLTRSGKSGKIVIAFYSSEELDGILGKILKEGGAQSL